MTQQNDYEIRLVKLETQMESNAAQKILDDENQREWREEARGDRKAILDAVNAHISDSAKVPGYQANGGVFVISKKMLVTAFLGVVGAIGTFVSFEFQIIGG